MMTVATDLGREIRDAREAGQGRGRGMVGGTGGTRIGMETEAGEKYGIEREGIGRGVGAEVGVEIGDQPGKVRSIPNPCTVYAGCSLCSKSKVLTANR